MGDTVKNGEMWFPKNISGRGAKSATSSPPSEHHEQSGFIHWFRHKFKGVLIFAIPNGEHRSISVAKRLKAEGVTRGVPDLFVPEWHLWIEMKRQSGGRLSKDQRNMMSHLESIGYTVIVGKGARDASEKVLEYTKAMLGEK